MSNIGSGIYGANAQSKTQRGLMGAQISDEKRREGLATPSARQTQFASGTMSLLDEARGLVENATQQGQELNPMIYEMLGLQPAYEDHSADLNAAKDAFDKAQKQFDEGEKTANSYKAIPPGKRTPEQKKYLRQWGGFAATPDKTSKSGGGGLGGMLGKMTGGIFGSGGDKTTTKGKPGFAGLSAALQKSLEEAKDAYSKLQTMPKSITGFTRMDPSQIPSTSPFSQNNPLQQIQHTEAERAQQAMEGGLAVDPFLVHQYTQAEGTLRANLAARYGPDYENSSVGQMALQNFDRQKSEHFANWNYNKQQEYAAAAYQQAGQLQGLTAGQIQLMREPSQWEANAGAQLAQQAGPRISEQQTWQDYLLRRSGLGQGGIPSAPMPQLNSSGGLAQLIARAFPSGTTAGAAAAPGTVQVPTYGGAGAATEAGVEAGAGAVEGADAAGAALA